MTGIVGLNLPKRRVQELLAQYAVDYYDASERAFDEAGTDRLPVSPSGHEPWEPAFPVELRPGWVDDVTVDIEAGEMRIDFDGPDNAGFMVTQTVIVDLHSWNRASPPRTVAFEVERVVIFATDSPGLNGEIIMTLEQAREHIDGMIAAGKLLAALLEGGA